MNWWLDRQKKDSYVKKREQEQLRSRAAFKLRELIQKFQLKKSSGPFIDLGSAPGGWTEILVQTYPNQLIVACDLLEMKPVNGSIFIQGDFTSDDIVKKIEESLNNQSVGGIFSDMAPNFSGHPLVEQSKMMNLTEIMRDFAVKKLQPKGFIVQKVFHGSEFENIINCWKEIFDDVIIYKPPASRSESSEVYIYAKKMKKIQKKD